MYSNGTYIVQGQFADYVRRNESRKHGYGASETEDDARIIGCDIYDIGQWPGRYSPVNHGCRCNASDCHPRITTRKGQSKDENAVDARAQGTRQFSNIRSRDFILSQH